MSRTPFTAAQVLALSPDDASSKAAKGLTSASKWPTLGANDDAVWGECQGSGSKPYQTQVDVSDGGTTFKCSCPSRKFPCKHGLALLLLQAQDASRFTASQPAWVTEWLTSRRDRAEKKEAKVAAVIAAKESQATDPAAANKLLEKEQKKEQQRWKQMQGGAQELGLWLNDVLRQGLASLSAHDQTCRQAQNMAARMVDAKVPALGQRLTQAMALVGQSKDWPEQLLAELGSLQLLIDAVMRVQDLPADVQAEVRQAAGWAIDKETVLTEGEAVTDVWQVLGVMTLERDNNSYQRLTERRVWARGQHSQRWALMLDFAFGGQGFTQTWLTEQRFEGTLRFYPGISPVRALLASTIKAATSTTPPQPSPQNWHDVAARMAANPWSPSWPLQLDQACLIPPSESQRHWSLWLGDTHALPLALAEADGWQWMAQTAGQPMTVFGEWDGLHLHPYTAWSSTAQWNASTWTDGK